MFKRNTDRLIIIRLSISCHSREGPELVKYLEANLPLVLKRRAESLSCETLQPDTDGFPSNVNVEFLLGLMEKPRVIYGISHLLYLAIKKFEKISVEIDRVKMSSEITDEGLKKLIKTIYDKLKKEKG
jgi:hypothetical protein